MRTGSQQDFIAGLFFTIVGAAFAWGSATYDVGTAARMGPGYFPMMLGIMLALLGVVITFRGARSKVPDGDPVGAMAWRPLIFILGANIAFGALLTGVPSLGIPAMGMLVAIPALVLIASFARKGASWRESVILAVVLTAGSYLAFVKLLNLQFPVLPSL